MTAPSLRRWYLDECYERTFAAFPGLLLLDVGGQRASRRGTFDPEAHALRVVIVNLRPETRPDVVAEAEHLPIRSGSVDTVLCSEVVEHVPSPGAVVGEIARALRPGGRAVLSAPFLVPVHGDPRDYQRVLPAQWRVLCWASGLIVCACESQGSGASVLVDGLAYLGWAVMPRRPWVGRGFLAAARRLMRTARWLDARWPVEGVTTGWVCVAAKP